MDVCFYLHVHQPKRLRNFSIFNIGKEEHYFDNKRNASYLKRIIKKSYLPTNRILYDAIEKTKGDFKVSFSITGVLLEQLQKFAPEVIESFQKLYDTGAVEFVGETYYHSLASVFSDAEFRKQVALQEKKLKNVFGATPTVFRNTELAYSDKIAASVASFGYKGILAEGVDEILGWRSPNFVYQSRNELPLLLKNYRLSDDIAFRFSERSWEEWPLDAGKFSDWISALGACAEVVSLFMDYETFGEHQWAETGIFEFLKSFPQKIFKYSNVGFLTPSEVFEKYKPKDVIESPEVISWADTERDLSAWMGNKLQTSALKRVYSLEGKILESKPELIENWRHLQTADHFYYMCTKWFADGDVHKYFNPYDSPYDAYINYMNILEDLEHKIEAN